MFPVVNFGALERYRVPAADWRGRLTDIDPADREGIPFPRPEAEAATASDIAEIDRLQEILYAQAQHALLVVLQGADTSGKDGTIRKVFSPLNPLGTVAVAFKTPTPPELAHDFLWRIHKAAPAAGTIVIFNRSHYEDVLVARVHGLVPQDRIEARYDQINRFERHLVENGVTILKFFLHISSKEQKARLQARLDDPTKRWKFNPDDPPSASIGTTICRRTRPLSNVAAANGRPGSSSRRTTNGTATRSSHALSESPSKRWT